MQPMVNIALRAARQAGEMIVKAADNLDSVKIDEKGRHDFVTEVCLLYTSDAADE